MFWYLQKLFRNLPILTSIIRCLILLLFKEVSRLLG